MTTSNEQTGTNREPRCPGGYEGCDCCPSDSVVFCDCHEDYYNERTVNYETECSTCGQKVSADFPVRIIEHSPCPPGDSAHVLRLGRIK